MYAKSVLLSLALRPMPSIFVVAPSNLVQRMDGGSALHLVTWAAASVLRMVY
jgi:hypothetical protein